MSNPAPGSMNMDAVIRKAFRDAETIRDLVHDRITKDGDPARGATSGQQTVLDLQELGRSGLAGLCKRMGIPQSHTEDIFLIPFAKMWLQEVVLKHMIFSMLLMGKSHEMAAAGQALSSQFGFQYIEKVANDALLLAEQFRDTFALMQKTGNKGLQAKLQQLVNQSLIAGPERERYHIAYTS